MKRVLALACVAVACAAHADDEKLGAGDTAPALGYSFDHRELLADQVIWGLAHGARLLAFACARGGHAAAAEAWVDWQEREQPQILATGRVLGRYYFGRDDAPPDAISGALGLKTALSLPPEQLAPACATLAEALAQPRFDLAKRREELLARRREEMPKHE